MKNACLFDRRTSYEAIAFRPRAFSMLASLSPTYSLLLCFDDDMQYLRLPRAIRHHLLSTFFPHRNRFCTTNHKGDEEVAVQVHFSVLRLFLAVPKQKQKHFSKHAKYTSTQTSSLTFDPTDRKFMEKY